MPLPVEALALTKPAYVVDIRDTYLAKAYGYPAQQGALPDTADQDDCLPVKGGEACVRNRLFEPTGEKGLDFYLPQSHDDDSTEFVDALAAHLTSRGILFDRSRIRVIPHDQETQGDGRAIYIGGLTPEQIEAIDQLGDESMPAPLDECFWTFAATGALGLGLYGLHRLSSLEKTIASKTPPAGRVYAKYHQMPAQPAIPRTEGSPRDAIEIKTAEYQSVLNQLREQEKYRPEPTPPASTPAPQNPRPIVPPHANQGPQSQPEMSFRATDSIPRQPRIIGLPGETQAQPSGDSPVRSAHIVRTLNGILYHARRFDADRQNPHGDPLVEDPRDELQKMNKGLRRLRKFFGL